MKKSTNRIISLITIMILIVNFFMPNFSHPKRVYAYSGAATFWAESNPGLALVTSEAGNVFSNNEPSSTSESTTTKTCFAVRNVIPGMNYKVTFSKTGYYPQTVTVTFPDVYTGGLSNGTLAYDETDMLCKRTDTRAKDLLNITLTKSASAVPKDPSGPKISSADGKAQSTDTTNDRAPRDLVAEVKVFKNGGSTVWLRWSAPKLATLVLSGYEIRREDAAGANNSFSGSGTKVGETNASTLTFSENVPSGQSYRYQVFTVPETGSGEIGVGSDRLEVNLINKANPTVTTAGQTYNPQFPGGNTDKCADTNLLNSAVGVVTGNAIGNAMKSAFCNLGVMLAGWATSMLKNSFCYLKLTIGYADSGNPVSDDWESCDISKVNTENPVVNPVTGATSVITGTDSSSVVDSTTGATSTMTAP